MRKTIMKVWAVRYINEKSMIAISSRKKCPRFNKNDTFSPFNDQQSYDIYPKDLANIKLPLNKPVRLKFIITIEKKET